MAELRISSDKVCAFIEAARETLATPQRRVMFVRAIVHQSPASTARPITSRWMSLVPS